MCSQSLRISQWIANLAMVANLAMWFANLAMRNFAKVLKFYVRQMNSACGLRISQCQFRNANFAMPTDCQLIAKIYAFFFFQIFNICSKILHKTSKINSRNIAEE